jgi:hypothetical protein
LIDPRHVFDANIFYPHRGTLFYSETNLAAGALGVPVYWVTHNAFATYNSVVILSFVLAGIGAYALVQYLTGSWQAAIAPAICFAFCPRAFSHLLQIHHLMTAGVPFALLALHRLVDAPSLARGAWLGTAMGVGAYACGYYAVFTVMSVSFGLIWMATSRQLWRSRRYWMAVGLAAALAIAIAAPLLAGYLPLQAAARVNRPLSAAQFYAADWRAYLASPAYAHAWMLSHLRHWQDALFPGFTLAALGTAGAIRGARAIGGQRDIAMFYMNLAALAVWESFGPAAGLYSLSRYVVPGFGFLRVPTNFAVVLLVALTVLAGLAIASAPPAAPTALRGSLAIAVAAVAAIEARTPIAFSQVPELSPAYGQLAVLERGPVLELPLYSQRFAFLRARYMLNSTAHWMPLVSGYSDFTPPDFEADQELLGGFPSLEGFAHARSYGVRYVVFHLDQYGSARSSLENQLRTFWPYLRPLYVRGDTWLYEVIGFPALP